MDFFINYDEILDRIDQINPIQYQKTRNHKNGALSYLSPFISRGVISTKFVRDRILKNGYSFWQAEKFIQELTWRDYWQQVWKVKQQKINQDLKHVQSNVHHHQIPLQILEHTTGIEVIDKGIQTLYKTGYVHNHIRMYLAAITCNIANSHWKSPTHWMYYHLLDGDWASNALSWQWVAGANANKKYYANQNNINTFFNSNQKNTFLDVSYDEISDLEIPEILKETTSLHLTTQLPNADILKLDEKLPVLIYNYYNLDPNWKLDLKANRILLLEPEIFTQYPVSKQCIDFVLFLAKNIPNIQVYTKSFKKLRQELYTHQTIYYKEHPLNIHYQGIEEPREWLFNVSGHYPSFFSYWKKCKKELKQSKA